jgi:hypothetical protein
MELHNHFLTNSITDIVYTMLLQSFELVSEKYNVSGICTNESYAQKCVIEFYNHEIWSSYSGDHAVWLFSGV